jgi:hypothetical protein
VRAMHARAVTVPMSPGGILPARRTRWHME